MALRHHQHCGSHSISSFNPTSCLRPPRTHDAISMCSDYVPVTCSSSIPSSQAFVVYPRSSSVREPSSPTVGCMGKVKKRNGAKGRYSKLLKLSRMFSDRSMAASLKSSSKVAVVEEDAYRSSRVVCIKDMDPPLPVVVKQVEADVVSLWRRRRGDGLKGLEL